MPDTPQTADEPTAALRDRVAKAIHDAEQPAPRTDNLQPDGTLQTFRVALARWLHRNTDCTDHEHGDETCDNCQHIADHWTTGYQRITDGSLTDAPGRSIAAAPARDVPSSVAGRWSDAEQGPPADSFAARVRAALDLEPTETDDVVVQEIGIYRTQLADTQTKLARLAGTPDQWTAPRCDHDHPLAQALTDLDGMTALDPWAPGEIAAAVAQLHGGTLATELAALLRQARANAKGLVKVMLGCAEKANAERASRQDWAIKAMRLDAALAAFCHVLEGPGKPPADELRAALDSLIASMALPVPVTAAEPRDGDPDPGLLRQLNRDETAHLHPEAGE